VGIGLVFWDVEVDEARVFHSIDEINYLVSKRVAIGADNYMRAYWGREHPPFKSAPAQNALPVPVSMPTRILGSSSIHSQTSWRSAWPWALRQFRSFGLFRVTRRMCGAG
jgi:hypothetical protein